MNLAWFRSHSAVILLAIVLHFCGQAKALPLAEEVPLNFEFSALWDSRLQSALKKPLNEVIIEDFLPTADQALTYEQVWNKIKKVHGRRITELDQKLPGFGTWLIQGLKADWGMVKDESSLDANICQNFSLHEQKQKVVACQSFQSVRFSKSWFLRAKKDADIAELFVHELVRYHTIRLGKTLSLDATTIDEITADVTYKILSTESPTELYQLLVSYDLLLSSTNVEISFLSVKLSIIKSIAKLENDIREQLKTCSAGTHEEVSEQFQQLQNRIGELNAWYGLRKKYEKTEFKTMNLQHIIQTFVNCISGVKP